MSLTVRLKNIGIIKYAEYSMGDLTIICGENNTGKTYIAYSLYGFLQTWWKLMEIPINDSIIEDLLTDGAIKIDLKPFVKKAYQDLSQTCQRFTDNLDTIFAAPEGTFKDSEFYIEPNMIQIPNQGFRAEIGINKEPFLNAIIEKGSNELVFTISVDRKLETRIDSIVAMEAISDAIGNTLFSGSFPRPFIFSSERTGVSIYRKELDFGRNRLLEEMGRSPKQLDMRELLLKAYQTYPLPIEDNVDFTRKLQNIAKRKSFIAKEYPEILEDFSDIIGGQFFITQDDFLYYTPKKTGLKLTMHQSSSSVRSLLDMSFYLDCIAEEGDLLMVDEPELNLHPKNQRRIARLFAKLVNLGIKVLITTHSDYIIKELNTLIMLNHDKPHLQRIVEENNYQKNELIDAKQVKVYIAEKGYIPLEEGQKRRRKRHTLVPAKIHPEFGIEVSSFDNTIDDMNRIQDDIVWGEE